MVNSHSEMPLPTGRIVVLAEMEDGTVRAIDGEGSGLIEVHTQHTDYNPFEPTLPMEVMGRITTVTITYPGQWTMYTSKHPDAPQQKKIKPSTKEIEK